MATVYNASFVYCREFAPGTVSLTGDWVRGDDSKHISYYRKEMLNWLTVCSRIMYLFVNLVISRFWISERDFGSDCTSSRSRLTFY